MTMTHNGWTNWATWNATLWFSNEETLHHEFMKAINKAWFDEDDNTWNDIDKAIAATSDLLREFVIVGITTDFSLDDLDEINYEEIVIGELEEINIADGRDRRIGLD